MSTGMTLSGDRIHRYVNAFCPLCRVEQPDRPHATLFGYLAAQALAGTPAGLVHWAL